MADVKDVEADKKKLMQRAVEAKKQKEAEDSAGASKVDPNSMAGQIGKMNPDVRKRISTYFE